EAEAAVSVEEGRRAGRPRMQPRQQRPVYRGVLRPEDFRNYWQDRALVEALAGFGVPPSPRPRPMFEPPGLPPVLPPARPGPTRADASLRERYPHLAPRLARDIPSEPGLTGEILSLPFRVLPAEAIGRALGWSPESEQAITRFVEQLGEPQVNPLISLTRPLTDRLSPEAQE